MKIINLIMLMVLVGYVGSLFYVIYLSIQMEWVDNMSRLDILKFLFKEHPVLLANNVIAPLFIATIGVKL
jgi:hypothetical protein